MDITNNKILTITKTKIRNLYWLRTLFAGILIPFGFAPFHFPGLAILGIALLFAEIQNKNITQTFKVGFIFGLGFMGFGVSWIYISIYTYGHLDKITSALITTVFISYTALYFALAATLYKILSKNTSRLFSCFLFSACWCLCEFLRAKAFSGFPWLLLGFGQIDTPLKHLLPIIGVYGLGFISTLAATFLANATTSKPKIIYLVAFIAVILLPLNLQSIKTSKLATKPISVGVVQANLAMRDKWDEDIFFQILDRYLQGINKLIKKAELIVLPESAIPVPEIYVGDFIGKIDRLTKKNHNTLLIGIPKTADLEENNYYNTLATFGTHNGIYSKQHLVPFGEYIPKPFKKIVKWLNIPDANMLKGNSNQPLLMVDKHTIASLICYEVAYPEILRKQLPKAEWIVSISDDGWFGHSFAIYQQQQMSQALSILTGRYQIVANNDGLSSIIDNNGNIINSAKAFSYENLYGEILPATGKTLWVTFGDKPFLFLSIMLTMIALFTNRRYP